MLHYAHDKRDYHELNKDSNDDKKGHKQDHKNSCGVKVSDPSENER